ncbi:MAG: N-acetylmuramoyl-L-alanine amidase [Pseudonocardiales bacterium]|nr:MAG: N-acetylmuramoyl-L-alanine amidase [Pseudonocardiales bacterium]
MRLIRRGDTGPAAADVRSVLVTLGLLPDRPEAAGAFDAECETALRTFQQRRGLIVDGLVGPDTFRALTAARWRLGDRVLFRSLSAPIVGDDVAVLQQRLLELGYDAGRPDGIFGVRTERALFAFQRETGISLDGTCGPATLRALHQLGRKVVGGRPQFMRESEILHHRGPALLGKRIVVDPGHGGDDPGHVYNALTEARVVWDLAARLEGRLGAVGVHADLTRGPDSGPSEVQRAEFANATGADLLVSLHVDANSNPDASGVATYHFGSGLDDSSTVGERLAGLVLREIVSRTGMVNCHTHGKTWEMLRLTRMPAVQLDLGYLTSPADRGRLADPGFRDVVAEALLVSIQRLYLASDIDPPTGTMRIPVAG